MRVLPASAFLLLLGLASVSAQDSVQDPSPQALADLETELLAWKRSNAGESAKKNGFVPASSSGMSIMGVGDLQTEELQRLLNAKREIAVMQQSQPHATFSLATPFALMTPAEYSAYLSRGLLPKRDVAPTATPSLNRTLHEETERRVLATLPTSVDWQQYGCVTAVKDQGGCNTCAAFATTASVESAICVKSGTAKTLVELSEQDQISCGAYEGNCLEAQFVQRALDWVQRLNSGSMCTKQSFSNTPTTSTTCQRYLYESVSCSKPNAGIVAYDGAFEVPYNTATFMEKVATQPLAVEINANLLQYYKSGVLMGNAATCGGATNHAVLLTGYGEDNGVKYWRAKNSWGPSWGEQGYFRIEQGYKGHPMGACLIEYSYHHPIVASDKPSVASRRASAWRQNVQQTGSLIDNTRSLDAYDCSEKCRVKDECKAFSYDIDNGMCQRLSSVGADTPRSKHQSGRILTRVQTDAQCLVPEWHFDFPGNDIRTVQTSTYTDCCDMCNKVDNCNAYVWTKFHGGSCYLKTKKSRSDWKGANTDGSAYFIPAEVYKCQPLIQNTDLTGKDIGNAPASRAESCCAECRLVDGCTGFTWTNYNGGTCWLKSGTFTQTANTGAMSALV